MIVTVKILCKEVQYESLHLRMAYQLQLGTLQSSGSIPYPASPGHDYLFFIYDVNNDIMHLPQFYSIRMEFWVTKESRHVFEESLSYSVFVLDDKQGEEGV